MVNIRTLSIRKDSNVEDLLKEHEKSFDRKKKKFKIKKGFSKSFNEPLPFKKTNKVDLLKGKKLAEFESPLLRR